MYLKTKPVQIYGFTSEIVDHGFRFTFKEMGLLVDASYCMVLLYVFCDCSHNASINIANRVQTTLLNIELSTVDLQTVKEVNIEHKYTHDTHKQHRDRKDRLLIDIIRMYLRNAHRTYRRQITLSNTYIQYMANHNSKTRTF